MQEKLFKKAFLYPTSNCNLNCNLCYAKKTLNQSIQTIEHLERYKNLVDRLIDVGVTEFDISGGEPLLYPYLFELLEYLIEQEVSVTMVSNGTLLYEKINHSNVSIIKKLTELHISIDNSIAEIHDNYRGCKGAFVKSIRGLKYLQHLGVNNLCINSLMFSGNFDNACNMLNLAKSLGVQKICLLRLLDLQYSVNENSSLSREEILKLLSNILDWIQVNNNTVKNNFCIELTLPGSVYDAVVNEYKLRLKNIFGNITLLIIFDPFRGCHAFQKNIVISSEGDVTGCTCMLGEPEYTVGNVFELSFKTIRERFNMAHQKLHELANTKSVCKKCSHLQICKGGCPVVSCNIGDNI